MSTDLTRTPNLSDEIAGLDHCDACGLTARPQVAFKHPTTDTLLAFCGHHTNSHSARLLADGWTLVADLRSDKSAFIPKRTIMEVAAPAEPEPAVAL